MEDYLRTYNMQDKIYVENTVKKLLGYEEIGEIKVNNIDKFGWTATIRRMDYDLLFTYYSDDCWKVETFPVAMMSGSIKRSIQIF